jgi:hypothetical protein
MICIGGAQARVSAAAPLWQGWRVLRVGELLFGITFVWEFEGMRMLVVQAEKVYLPYAR